MNHFIAPRGWTPADPNPFTTDGAYAGGWSCLAIDGDNPRTSFIGRNDNGLFTFRIGSSALQLATSLGDFLRYEKSHERQVIIAASSLDDADALARRAIADTCDQRRVRPEDPRWAVHSTTADAWRGIQRDGALRSLAALRREGAEVLGLGIAELGEPADYAEYVVLGRVDEMNAEHVVSSRQKGRIVTDPDCPYSPGVRLYFDNHMIIRNGLAVRDGLHLTKVRESLPLAPYLAATVSAADFPDQTWTPMTFWQAANSVFYARIARVT